MGPKKLGVLILVLIIEGCVAPPVAKTKEESKEEQGDGLEDYMEYHRYLKEVVNALESDPEFRNKLEKAEEADIRSGKIAHELEFVSHQVRTRLDEIKRMELVRLRDLTEKKHDLIENNFVDDPNHHGHVDHSNPHTFEIEDLRKLILKTTEDLAEADRKRREEFKQYEMQKELDKQQKLNETNGDEKEKLEKHYKDLEEKHKKHDKLHEPGHKAQLEEVWEEQDHMQQEFDPKTFFMLHDLDSNGLWDQDEVKALFIKELDKMYAAGAPEDDMRERIEEMERMRETVFKEVDMNRDGFIDFNEFLMQTKKQDFQQDHGWQGLDEQKPYTDEELAEYMRQRQMQQGGYGYYGPPPGGYPSHGYPPPPGYHPNQVPPGAYHPNASPQGYHPNQGYQVPPQMHQVPQQGHHMPPPGQMHPQAPQQGHHAPQQGYQVPPQGYQAPQGHQVPQGQQMPQGQQIPQQGQQVPQQGQQVPQQGNQMPHQGQPASPQGQQASPQGQIPAQAPQKAQFQPGQLPQAQVHPQQIPSQDKPNPPLNTNEVYPNPQGNEVKKQGAVPQVQRV